MIHLSAIGLALDLIGVMMLGVDLVRVQRNLRHDAEERLSALRDVTEGVGGIDRFLKTVSGDFREYERDEGAYSPRHGTFDSDSAERSIEELKDGINSVADNVGILAAMIVAGVEGDRKTVSKSLIFSYAGLALILLGFGLQIPAYL
jgi:hypothetical protein